MTLELRPSWCLPDDGMTNLISLDPWKDASGTQANARDGDDWKPGEGLRLSRGVGLQVEPMDLRRKLGLRAGASVGIAARWSCRATSLSGVHSGGPLPVDLTTFTDLVLDIPITVAGAIELETCVLVTWPDESAPAGGPPDRGLVWSDGWSVSPRDRTVLLEGSEVRIPVRNVSFARHFGEPSGALWAIDLDPSIEPGDLVSNVVTVLLNLDVLERDFRGVDDEPDPGRMPRSALAGISVDLVRSLTAVLLEELDESEQWTDLSDGSVGALLSVRLSETFGTSDIARREFLEDQASFSRRLWDRFAPDSWKV